MHRIAVLMTLGAVLATPNLPAFGEDSFTFEFDADIPGDSVEVRYYLAGRFGGRGGFVSGTRDRMGEVSVPLYHDEWRAESMRAYVYAKGCQIRTYVFDPLAASPNRAKYECHKLGTVRMHGVISGAPQPSRLKVQFRYLAHWDHPFFGMMDGMVSMLTIAEVKSDDNGEFDVELPDFARDPVTSSYEKTDPAVWWINADGPKDNERYYLNADGAEEGPGSHGDMAFAHEYPDPVRFTARKF